MNDHIRDRTQRFRMGNSNRSYAAALVLGGLLAAAFPAEAADTVGTTDLTSLQIHGATVGMTEKEAIAKWEEAGFTKQRKNLMRDRPDGRDIILYETVVPWEKAKDGPSQQDREWVMGQCEKQKAYYQDMCKKKMEEQLAKGSPLAFAPQNRLVSRIEYKQRFDDSTPVDTKETTKQLEARFGDVDDAGGVLLYVDDTRTPKAAQALVDKCDQKNKGSMKSLLKQDRVGLSESSIERCYPNSLDTRIEAARYMGARTLTIRVRPNRQNQIDMDFRWPYLEGKRSLNEDWAKSHGGTKEKTAQMSF